MEKYFELIETELTRARAMAVRADAPFLVYLIEMAMIEARAKAQKNSLETLDIEPALRPSKGTCFET